MAVNDQAAAAQALLQVLEKGKSTDQLKPHSAFAQALIFGTLRHFFSLRQQVDERLDSPLRNKDKIIYFLMLVGAYQLRFSTKPDHAVVNETVRGAANIGRPWARGLLNGVLRNLPAACAHHEHPEWFAQRVQQDYPQQWQAILQANNTRAPMQVRVNSKKIQPSEYRSQLDDAGIEYHLGPSADSLSLATPVATKNLPGYQAGQVSVQDFGAQAAAEIFADSIDLPLLDACSSPGHKLFHLMERQTHQPSSFDPDPGTPAWTAAEKSAPRMDYLQAEAERLKHSSIRFQLADATAPQWPAATFKTILIDAPCSGSGTLRRHPDIKHLRIETDIANYARLQYDLLVNLWPVLQPGGRLLYSTCSIFHDENDGVIQRFLDQAFVDQAGGQAQVQQIMLPNANPTQFGCQLLPPTTDGFYYALIKKILP